VVAKVGLVVVALAVHMDTPVAALEEKELVLTQPQVLQTLEEEVVELTQKISRLALEDPV
jgi:hypothetical protein